MEQKHGFDYFRLSFDAEGKLERQAALDELKQHADQAGATDAILIAHGFRNDENDASGLYDRFLETFRGHLGRPEFQQVASRKFVAAGVYWPSKSFKESFGTDEGSVKGIDDEALEKEAIRLKLEELKAGEANAARRPKIDRAMQLLDRVQGDAAAQDEFVDLVLSLLDGAHADPTEGLEQIRAKPGSELLEALKFPIILPTEAAEADEGGAMSAGAAFPGGGGEGEAQGFGSLFGSIFGRIGQFLNLTTWYIMKERAGTVGANGVPKAVRELKASRPQMRIHLVGHSLGGRLMAACAKALASPKVQPDSLTLLEAAFSHYGFSSNNGSGQTGFFRAVLQDQVVKGPLVATFSAQDAVVGQVYAIASRLAGDNVRAIGDKDDPFGGIGRNGAQKTAEAIADSLHAAGAKYNPFSAGKVVCLDGSGGLIKNHGDVTNENVTYAFAAAVACT